MKLIRINIKLLPVKIHYFIFMAGLACALPFRTVLAKQLGISATAVGVIFLAVPFLKVITNPLFGFIIDYFKKFRLTIGVFLLVVAVTHVGMVFIPPMYPSQTGNPVDIKFRAKVDYIPNLDAVENSEKNRTRLIMDSILLNSNGKYKEFVCKLKCRNDNISVNKEQFKESRNKGLCNKSLLLEIKISAKVRGCKMDVYLRSAMFLSKTNVPETHLAFDKEKSAEMPYDSQTHHTNLKCLKVVSNAFYSSNYSLATLEKIKNEYAFGHTNISDLLILLQNNLNVSTKEQNETSGFTDSLTFSRIKEYDIKLRVDKKNDEGLVEVHRCKEEFECVSTECFTKYTSEHIAIEMQKDEFMTVQFWGIFILTALSSVSFCAVMFLMDAICCEMLFDKNETYGGQRLWGTIGWGFGALIGGYLNQILSPDPSNIDYSPSFYLLALLVITTLLPIYFIEVGNVKYSSNICKDVGLLLSKLDIIMNVLIVFMVGVLSGLIWNYQFWFMEEIGASQVLLGLSQLFECLLGELPCFIASGWIIRKLGYNHCNSITFLCFGLRYLCFAYMYNPWMTLPLAIIHGPTFGLFYPSMITYGKSEALPGTEATVQALLSMSFEGVGAATGSILGGIGFDKLGSRMTFLYAGVVSFILLFANIILHMTLLKEDKNKRLKKELT